MFNSVINFFANLISPTKEQPQQQQQYSNSNQHNTSINGTPRRQQRQRVSFDPKIFDSHYKSQHHDRDVRGEDQQMDYPSQSFLDYPNLADPVLRHEKQSSYASRMNRSQSQMAEDHFLQRKELSLEPRAKRPQMEASFNANPLNVSHNTSLKSTHTNYFNSSNHFQQPHQRSISHRNNQISIVRASPAKEILKRLTEMAENPNVPSSDSQWQRHPHSRVAKSRKNLKSSKMFSLPQNPKSRLNQHTVTKAKTQSTLMQHQIKDQKQKSLPLPSKAEPQRKFAFSYQPIEIDKFLNGGSKETDSQSGPQKVEMQSAKEKSAVTWKCQICCFSNDDADETCAACDTLRPGKFKPTEKEKLFSKPMKFKTETIKPAAPVAEQPKNETKDEKPKFSFPKSSPTAPVTAKEQKPPAFSFEKTAQSTQGTASPSEKNTSQDDSFKFATSSATPFKFGATKEEKKPESSPSKVTPEAAKKQESKPEESSGGHKIISGFSLVGASTAGWSTEEGANPSSDQSTDKKSTQSAFPDTTSNPFANKAPGNSSASKPAKEENTSAAPPPQKDFSFASSIRNEVSKPKFSFGSKPPADSSSNAASSNSGGFSFGPSSNAQEPSKPAFSFGDKKTTSTAPSPGFSFTSQTQQNVSDSAPKFNFGSAATSSASKEAQPNVPKFSFNTSNAAAPSTSTSTDNLFKTVFNTNSSSTGSPSTNLFTPAQKESQQPQSTPGFSFGNTDTSSGAKINPFASSQPQNANQNTNIFTSASQNPSTNLFSGSSTSSVPNFGNLFAPKSETSQSASPNLFQTSQTGQQSQDASQQSANNAFNPGQRMIRKAFRRSGM